MNICFYFSVFSSDSWKIGISLSWNSPDGVKVRLICIFFIYQAVCWTNSSAKHEKLLEMCLKCLKNSSNQTNTSGGKNDGAFKGGVKETRRNKWWRVSFISSLCIIWHQQLCVTFSRFHLPTFDFSAMWLRTWSPFQVRSWTGTRNNLEKALWLMKICNYIILKIQIFFGKPKKTNLSSM